MRGALGALLSFRAFFGKTRAASLSCVGSPTLIMIIVLSVLVAPAAAALIVKASGGSPTLAGLTGSGQLPWSSVSR